MYNFNSFIFSSTGLYCHFGIITVGNVLSFGWSGNPNSSMSLRMYMVIVSSYQIYLIFIDKRI